MLQQLLLTTGEVAATAGVDAAGQVAEAPSALAMIIQLVPMLAIFVIFYFLLIRPQRKKDKAAKQMLKQLKVGDRVCTIGGIYGTIAGIKDDTLTLSVGPGQEKVKMVFARWAIRNVEELSIANDAESLV